MGLLNFLCLLPVCNFLFPLFKKKKNIYIYIYILFLFCIRQDETSCLSQDINEHFLSESFFSCVVLFILSSFFLCFTFFHVRGFAWVSENFFVICS